MSDLTKQIEALHQQAADIAEATSDIYNGKADFALKTIGVLLETLSDAVEDLMEGVNKKEYYDASLASTIKETLSEIATKFSEIKAPVVTVSPNIQVDLKPLQTVAEQVANQNKNIIELLGTLKSKESNEGAVEKELLLLIKNNNEFIAKAFQQYDYSKLLKEIADNLGKKDDDKTLVLLKVQRDQVGRVETLTPVYK